MSIQNASSSCKFASSSTQSLVEKLNKTKIASCVLAMSKIQLNPLSKNFAHAALLLIDSDSNVEDAYRGSGIVIEYGDYSPKMSKEEEEAVKNGTVIYRYGDKGGLRYYAIDYIQYIKIFGDICYVNMDIESDNQMTFQYFLDNIAPDYENIWIQEKYNIDILKEFIENEKDYNHNCQSFASKALNLLKPLFNQNMIIVTDTLRKTENKIDAFPTFIQEILNILKNN